MGQWRKYYGSSENLWCDSSPLTLLVGKPTDSFGWKAIENNLLKNITEGMEYSFAYLYLLKTSFPVVDLPFQAEGLKLFFGSNEFWNYFRF